MLKQIKHTLLTLMVFTVSFSSYAQQYISDELFTYMHAGHSNQYRIIGSINAGETIEILKNNEETGYSEIIDSKGRQGWIQTKFITPDIPLRIQLEEANTQIVDIQHKLDTLSDQDNLSSELKAKTEALSVLSDSYDELQTRYDDVEDKLTLLTIESDESLNRILLRYYLFGGLTIVAGLIIGLLLPKLYRTRRSSGGNWS